jgi:hypothetical protein
VHSLVKELKLIAHLCFSPFTVFLLYCQYFFILFLFCSCLFFIIVVATLSEHMAKLLKRQGALPMDEHEEMDGLTPPVPSPERAAVRPTQLPIISPLRPAESQPVTSSPTCGLADEATTEARDGIGTFVAALNGVSPG